MILCFFRTKKINEKQTILFSPIRSTVPITWKNARENQHPTVGETFIVQCEVAANPAPNVDWLRNGDPVSIFYYGELFILNHSNQQ